jgi:hypothetical protein
MDQAGRAEAASAHRETAGAAVTTYLIVLNPWRTRPVPGRWPEMIGNGVEKRARNAFEAVDSVARDTGVSGFVLVAVPLMED